MTVTLSNLPYGFSVTHSRFENFDDAILYRAFHNVLRDYIYNNNNCSQPQEN
jgi:hypothetical protein